MPRSSQSPQPNIPTPADPLSTFTAPTRTWFTQSFSAPTPAQHGAWQAISSDHHALVVAPTGSGKTLAAFLWAIDQMVAAGPTEPNTSVQVLYVSPLKALTSDIERNLHSPLVGIRNAAETLGLPTPHITIGARTGDTPAAERRHFPKKPPHILVTTPESLFLLLTAKARSALTGVTTVIIDEIHALAGTKRGAHLAVTLERLDQLVPTPTQRIGLSATVSPIDTVAAFLSGTKTPGPAAGRPVTIVKPPNTKKWDLQVHVPLADLSTLGQPLDDPTGPAAGAPRTVSIWPYIETDIVNRIDPIAHPGRSTLIFTNARRAAERLTARLNEKWAERTQEHPDPLTPTTPHPIEKVGTHATTTGSTPDIARAHHGSVAKDHRKDIEEALKTGTLPAVVATSSLELGIDMGAIDTVIHVAPPPSVAAGLQRIGRAGHQVGATSTGIIYPKHRSELLPTATLCEHMITGTLEPLKIPSNPLDVLAQQLVAITAMDDITHHDALHLIRNATPYATLTEAVFNAVLDMLTGLYPSTEFAELKPRLTWDRTTGLLTARPGANRLAVTSGGTIPDRGLFGVFLASTDQDGKRVGELDEEMVYESRVGDVFTLGSSTWRIEEITHDRVLVTPAPGQPARLPFWRGENQGRPAELGQAIGQLTRELTTTTPLAHPTNHHRLTQAGFTPDATTNTLTYLQDQLDHTGHIPTDTTLVLERFRDELGDWNIVLHSPYGITVHAPWALVINATLQEQLGINAQTMPHDDGIVIRIPDMVSDTTESPNLDHVRTALLADPDTIYHDVSTSISDSTLFTARFRECAARALLLPKRGYNTRQPLWQMRLRAAALLEIAIKYPTFPIVLETVRECLQDVYDVPALTELLHALHNGRIKLVDIDSDSPSPFATSLLFGYVAQFLYEGDSPLAERRAAALTLDPELLADLLGRSEGTSLAELLDPQVIITCHQELRHLTPERHLHNEEHLADALRTLGPLTLTQITERTTHTTEDINHWLTTLTNTRRIITVTLAGHTTYCAIEDAGLLQDALGVALPPGIAASYLRATTNPLEQLLERFARTRACFTAHSAAAAFGLGVSVVSGVLRSLSDQKKLYAGHIIPLSLWPELDLPTPATHEQYASTTVLKRLKNRSLAALRADVEPVEESTFTTFLCDWQNVQLDQPATGPTGVDGTWAAVDTLTGAAVAASALETLILPARVTDYRPEHLDDLITSGDVTWVGRGSLPGNDGFVSLHPTETLSLTRPQPQPLEQTQTHQALLTALASGGAFFYHDLIKELPPGPAYAEALWDLAWSGYVTCDTLAPLRALVSSGKSAHKAPRRSTSRRRFRTARPLTRTHTALTGVTSLAPAHVAPALNGRWSLLPPAETDPTLVAHATAEVLMARYGVLTRGSVQNENVPGGFSAIYKVLTAQEDHGTVRRGYFVAHRGASQFAAPAHVDTLRATTPRGSIALAATDPANPYGASLPWPPTQTEHTKHKPGRRAGAIVVLVAGELALYMERGAKTLLTFTADPDVLEEAAAALVRLVTTARLATVTINTINGESALHSEHPVKQALLNNGCHVTPKGLRARR